MGIDRAGTPRSSPAPVEQSLLHGLTKALEFAAPREDRAAFLFEPPKRSQWRVTAQTNDEDEAAFHPVHAGLSQRGRWQPVQANLGEAMAHTGSDEVIESLVLALCPSAPAREKHLYRESLRALVRLAQAEQMHSVQWDMQESAVAVKH